MQGAAQGTDRLQFSEGVGAEMLPQRSLLSSGGTTPFPESGDKCVAPEKPGKPRSG